MGHASMHNSKRAPQAFPSSILLPSSIPRPGEPTVTNTGSLSFDTGQSVLTTFLRTVAVPATSGTRIFTSTRVDTVFVDNPVSFASIKASQSSSKAYETESASSSVSPASATSKAAGPSSSSNNLNTLIPAIVVPIAVVLIASFVAFWLMMRRRHKKQQKEEPQFVMASKTEKPFVSRGNSHSSGHSSTRELVPMSKLEKETVFMKNETKRPFEITPPKYMSSEIGIARPMTPPDRPSGSDAGQDKTYRNFSSVRPGTRNRSGTGSGNHKAVVPQNVSSPQGPGRNSPARSVRGPSLQMRGPTGPSQRLDRPEGPVGGVISKSFHGPSSSMDQGRRAPPPQSLNTLFPTGAFNGASPISQYSPIVKDQGRLRAAAATEISGGGSQTASLPHPSSVVASHRTDSPSHDDVLSHENIRIARLANSSRLGPRESPVEPSSQATTRALAPVPQMSSGSQPVVTSPQLPPPLTKESFPAPAFVRGPDSPAGGSSVYPSPSIGAGMTPRIGGGPSAVSLPQSERTNGIAVSTVHQRHLSAISRLSSDDGYVDMELDAKSDVSSLDEHEKWEMELDKHDANSHLGAHLDGYGSTGMSPIDGPASSTATSAGTGKPNLRDRDSEGPFVLSRY